MPVAFDTSGMEQYDERTWFCPRTGDQVSLTYIDLVPDLPAPLDDLPLLRHRLALETAEIGALIEAHVVMIDSVPALYQLLKLPIPDQDSGQAFIAAFTVPKATCSAVLRIQCAEGENTGVRESAVIAQVGPEAFVRPHPYAPVLEGRLPWHVGDEERWDGRFPEHPLSRARVWANKTVTTARIDPAFAKLPSFTPGGPGPNDHTDFHQPVERPALPPASSSKPKESRGDQQSSGAHHRPDPKPMDVPDLEAPALEESTPVKTTTSRRAARRAKSEEAPPPARRSTLDSQSAWQLPPTDGKPAPDTIGARASRTRRAADEAAISHSATHRMTPPEDLNVPPLEAPRSAPDGTAGTRIVSPNSTPPPFPLGSPDTPGNRQVVPPGGSAPTNGDGGRAGSFPGAGPPAANRRPAAANGAFPEVAPGTGRVVPNSASARPGTVPPGTYPDGPPARPGTFPEASPSATGAQAGGFPQASPGTTGARPGMFPDAAAGPNGAFPNGSPGTGSAHPNGSAGTTAARQGQYPEGSPSTGAARPGTYTETGNSGAHAGAFPNGSPGTTGARPGTFPDGAAGTTGAHPGAFPNGSPSTTGARPSTYPDGAAGTTDIRPGAFPNGSPGAFPNGSPGTTGARPGTFPDGAAGTTDIRPGAYPNGSPGARQGASPGTTGARPGSFPEAAAAAAAANPGAFPEVSPASGSARPGAFPEIQPGTANARPGAFPEVSPGSVSARPNGFPEVSPGTSSARPGGYPEVPQGQPGAFPEVAPGTTGAFPGSANGRQGAYPPAGTTGAHPGSPAEIPPATNGRPFPDAATRPAPTRSGVFPAVSPSAINSYPGAFNEISPGTVGAYPPGLANGQARGAAPTSANGHSAAYPDPTAARSGTFPAVSPGPAGAFPGARPGGFPELPPASGTAAANTYGRPAASGIFPAVSPGTGAFPGGAPNGFAEPAAARSGTFPAATNGGPTPGSFVEIAPEFPAGRAFPDNSLDSTNVHPPSAVSRPVASGGAYPSGTVDPIGSPQAMGIQPPGQLSPPMPRTGEPPVGPGDIMHTVLIGLPIGGYLPLWHENAVSYWRMTDPTAVRARVGAGIESRTEIDNRRFREAALFTPERNTLFLTDRFRNGQGNLGGASTQLIPATEDEAYRAATDKAMSEFYGWLGDVVVAAGQRGEYVAIETGGWHVPVAPVVLIMLRTDGREWHSVVETSPVPHGAPVWRDQQPVDGDTQLLASPATDRTMRAAGLLTRFAVATWPMHPLQLGLSFGPNPTLGDVATR